MKKIICLLLVMVLALSTFPVSASAAETPQSDSAFDGYKISLYAYYDPYAIQGAWIDSTLIEMADIFQTKVYNPKKNSKIILSTDSDNIYRVRLAKVSNNILTPVTKSIVDAITAEDLSYTYSWDNISGRNYNTTVIDLSDISLSNGMYFLHCYDNSDGSGGLSGFFYSLIIRKTSEKPVNTVPPAPKPQPTPRQRPNETPVPPAVIIAQSPLTQFPDVPQSHWAYSGIMALVERGALSGYADGLFRPDELVLRNEFAVMMTRALKIPLVKDAEQTFADVEKSNWDFEFVETAKKYLTGYELDGKYYFRGNDMAVREDMTVALVKALGLEKELQNDAEGQLRSIFSDYMDISFNLRPFVLTAYEHNLISGYPDGSFGPQKPITRAEAASLLERIVKMDLVKKVTFE